MMLKLEQIGNNIDYIIIIPNNHMYCINKCSKLNNIIIIILHTLHSTNTHTTVINDM